MNHPYFWLSIEWLGTALVWSGMLTGVLMLFRQIIARKLKVRHTGVPSRVVYLDIPWSLQKTEAAVREWKETGLEQRALLKNRLDGLIHILYPSVLSLACVQAAFLGEGVMRTTGLVLSWLILICIPIGVLRSRAVLRMLQGNCRSAISSLGSALLRSMVFLLTVISLLYIVLSLSL
ncbi:MAG: hypothetical protein OQK67_00280 [Chlorobium sp.]|nr:hypothetical protein [Chlorobium sp.]MCW8814373.1 hypothetical protein [Chlorobium sp.]MCW8818716.1 hypothetical protein [Ignavibacteriaceae bacterium]